MYREVLGVLCVMIISRTEAAVIFVKVSKFCLLQKQLNGLHHLSEIDRNLR